MRVEGDVFKQSIKYEWLPLFCDKCVRAGHFCEEAPRRIIQKWIPKKITTLKPVENAPQVTPEEVIPVGTSDKEVGWEPAMKTWKNSGELIK